MEVFRQSRLEQSAGEFYGYGRTLLRYFKKLCMFLFLMGAALFLFNTKLLKGRGVLLTNQSLIQHLKLAAALLLGHDPRSQNSLIHCPIESRLVFLLPGMNSEGLSEAESNSG